MLRIPQYQPKQLMLASLLSTLGYILNDLHALGGERLSRSRR